MHNQAWYQSNINILWCIWPRYWQWVQLRNWIIFFPTYFLLSFQKTSFCFQLSVKNKQINLWNLPGVPKSFKVFMRREDTDGAVISGNKVITYPCSLRKKNPKHYIMKIKCRNNQIGYFNKFYMQVNNTT